MAAPPLMHLRVKRKNETMFLLVEPSDSFGKLRAKVAEIAGQKTERVRLLRADKTTPFEDESLVSDHELADDSVIYLVVQQDGGSFEAASADNLEASMAAFLDGPPSGSAGAGGGVGGGGR